ncbi:AAA family ATPase [Falsiruegeria mediterranea]|uniref:AAA family ATPase n=1 Tax=Falsiruegeria mediterranea TaxID=1280832 RepID=UPI0015F25B2D|nr:AAA family ATPase [Falsiruegeria mediterranea]
MNSCSFRFLVCSDNRPYRPSRCFVVADPKIDDRKQWELQLEPPDEDAWSYEISDIKDWMLHGKPKRQIIFDRSNPKTPFRDLVREEVFREYLRKILNRIPVEHQPRRKYALMPSIADENSRTRYKSAIEAVIPDVVVLPEPEMVAEYFRLVKQNLQLEAGENNILLVVDIGAATANMTIIVSRRDRKILDLDAKGAQRDLRLRALRGDSDDRAGRWVDTRLLEMLDLTESPTKLHEVEQAKVQASSTGEKAVVSQASKAIDRSVLKTISTELWMELRPLFERLCERLYENQVSSDDARQKSETRRREREVNTASDAHRLIDTILLAGGTSQLPGFEEAMFETLFPDGKRPSVLQVGSAFSIAAAAGGLAHILHRYEPSRIREAAGSDSALFVAELESTLPHALILGIKKKGEQEQSVTVLDPDDPFVDDGGQRIIRDIPPLSQGSEPKTRLVPAPSAGIQARRGKKFLPTSVNCSPAEFALSWDPNTEKAQITSECASQLGHLWFDAGRLRKREEASSDPFNEPMPPGALAVDAAEDIILDIGMSKIVAVTAERGWVSADELERIVENGYSSSTGLPLDAATIAAPTANGDQVADPSTTEDSETEFIQEDRIVRSLRKNPLTSASRNKKNQSKPSDSPKTNESSSKQNPGRDGVREASLSAARTSSHVNFGPDSYNAWNWPVSDTEFSQALTSIRDAFQIEAPELRFEDLVFAILALTVRPIVLLAGPPGCGKSTLVRLIARILGKQSDGSFHDVAVQAHWDSDRPLFDTNGQLTDLLANDNKAHLVLFDEFNLTRPEYYLSRLFHALESEDHILSHDQIIAPCRVFGTLNIDESSRPPSPKVIDRCFLIELTQASLDIAGTTKLTWPKEFNPLQGLPEVSLTGPISDERMDGVLSALQQAVQDHGLRHDLLPSRRVINDVCAMLSLHHRLDLQGRNLLDRSELVDRLIASRILIKLSGAFDQLSPALEALEELAIDLEGLPRTQRRLKLARQQARLGFVSPWQ